MNRTHCNNVIRHALSVKFGRVFALSLSGFFGNVAGFDIVSFNNALFNGQGRLEENVLQQYGDEGILIIRKLLLEESLSDDEKDEAAKCLGRYYVASVSGFHERQLFAI